MAKNKPSAAPGDAATVMEVGWRGALVALLVVVAVGAAWWWWRSRPPDAATVAPTVAGTPVAAGTGAATVVAPASGGIYAGQPQWTTPEGDAGLGPQSAPVTVVVFSDYQCPNCRQFAQEVLPWMAATWMPSGLVRVVYRDFPIRGPESNRAAEAARCAGEQGAYWAYHALLFDHQSGENKGAFADPALKGLAGAAGLDEAAFAACLDSGRMKAPVDAAAAYARQQGFEGTPAYVINGRSTSGAIPVERWNELLALYAQQFGTTLPAATRAAP